MAQRREHLIRRNPLLLISIRSRSEAQWEEMLPRGSKRWATMGVGTEFDRRTGFQLGKMGWNPTGNSTPLLR
jgi:hypothetical protein